MTPQDQLRFPPAAVRLRGGEAVKLRLLSSRDGEALANFYASVPRVDYHFYCPHPLDRPHALAKAAAADEPLSVVLVADAADGRIAGYAWFRWKCPSAERSTFGICIRREFQGLGLGMALMTRLDELARSVGPAVMDLTVQKANGRAAELYQKMGFRIVREQLRERDGEAEYYMERRVR